MPSAWDTQGKEFVCLRGAVDASGQQVSIPFWNVRLNRCSWAS